MDKTQTYVPTTLIKDDIIEPVDFNIIDAVNHTASVCDIFDWCMELGIVMTLGRMAEQDDYFINLNKGNWHKSVYISSEILKVRPMSVYDLIVNAVKELDLMIKQKEC